MRIILASESPGRKQALQEAGFVFEVVPSNFNEDIGLNLSPKELTIYLSQGKARSVAAKYQDAVIIGADTVAVFENKILGKPHTEENAIRMLSTLSGNVHSMITGLTVIDTHNKKEVTRSVETKIWFRHIPLEEIIEYSKTGEALKKAGGYAYQLNGHKFVERIEGSESNIIGLPLEELKKLLEDFSLA